MEKITRLMKLALCSFAIAFTSNAVAAPVWYESTIVEVSVNSGGHLFIRTESNPNPAECGGNWAGASFGGTTENATSLAASIALSAKITKSPVRFQIDDANCGVGGLPIMLWLQQR